jgi:hypothetical protein
MASVVDFESKLRAFWYTMEVTSRSNTDIGSGFVHVVWDKYSSIRDFDRYLWDRYLRHMTNAWPIKSVAIHSCCTPFIVVRFIKPSKSSGGNGETALYFGIFLLTNLYVVLFALINKDIRSRMVFHGPESELFNSLSAYGILKSMLPSYMGGDVDMNMTEWIENRRALEMEEI